MRPINVGDLLLYESSALNAKVIGVVVEVLTSGEAYLGPFYRVSWNHPDYYHMEKTVYDLNQVMLWRKCFIEFESS